MSVPSATDLNKLLESRPGYREGRPCLRGTGITVHAIAAAHTMGLSTEEICSENPDLDPALIHAALAYYFANREQIDAELESDRRRGEQLAAAHPNGVTAGDVLPR